MNRREFFSAPLVTAAMAASSGLAQGTPRYDMVLKGGHVIDVANGISRQMDVAVQGGKIARVGPALRLRRERPAVEFPATT